MTFLRVKGQWALLLALLLLAAPPAQADGDCPDCGSDGAPDEGNQTSAPDDTGSDDDSTDSGDAAGSSDGTASGNETSSGGSAGSSDGTASGNETSSGEGNQTASDEDGMATSVCRLTSLNDPTRPRADPDGCVRMMIYKLVGT